MERPGRADDGVKQTPVRVRVIKNAEHTVSGDGENAVEREKIGGERDQEIAAVGDNVTAVATYAEAADSTTHEQNPEGVGQFVAEDINDDRPRQAKKRNQTQDRP